MGHEMSCAPEAAWSIEMQNRLLELIFEMSYSDIATTLSVEFGVVLSRSSIAGKALRMNLVKRKHLRVPAVPLTPVPVPAPLPPLLPGKFCLLELPARGCKWAVDYINGAHMFCGAEQLELRSYCKVHEKLAYVRARTV
jgi:hypothetical protein